MEQWNGESSRVVTCLRARGARQTSQVHTDRETIVDTHRNPKTYATAGNDVFDKMNAQTPIQVRKHIYVVLGNTICLECSHCLCLRACARSRHMRNGPTCLKLFFKHLWHKEMDIPCLQVLQLELFPRCFALLPF
jgi:hypothetical protein